MLHARDDYNRIQDPKKKIPKDEPVFLLRAQDPLAAGVVRKWADALEQRVGSNDMVQKARAHADLMDAWPTKKVLPDLAAAPPAPQAADETVTAD